MKNDMETIDIKGKSYITVNERLKFFCNHFPNGSISTEIVSHEDGKVLMKTTVLPDVTNDKRFFTGFAQEKDGATFINRTSYIENCETSAIGRALGIMGIGIDTSVASAEEVMNAMEQQKPQAYWSEYDGVKYYHIKSVSTLGEVPPVPFLDEHAQLGYQFESAMRNMIKTGVAEPTIEIKPTPNIKTGWKEICEAMDGWMERNWNDFKLEGNEIQGLSEQYRVTGKLDDQGTYKGKTCFVDYKKTKRITKQIRDIYFMQLAGYTLIDNADQAVLEPELLVIITPFDDPIATTDVDKYQKMFIKRLEEYKKKFNLEG